MKLYKFSELNSDAKRIAAKSYKDGWMETHPDDNMTLHEAFEGCIDIEDDVLYHENGEDAEEA